MWKWEITIKRWKKPKNVIENEIKAKRNASSPKSKSEPLCDNKQRSHLFAEMKLKTRPKSLLHSHKLIVSDSQNMVRCYYRKSRRRSKKKKRSADGPQVKKFTRANENFCNAKCTWSQAVIWFPKLAESIYEFADAHDMRFHALTHNSSRSEIAQRCINQFQVAAAAGKW